jgi:hypothetical protein
MVMVDNITNNNSTNDSFGKLKPQITEMTTIVDNGNIGSVLSLD